MSFCCWERVGTRLLSLLALSFVLAAPSLAQLRAAGPARPLTDGAQLFMNPSWSPDGSAIAFTGVGYTGIYVRRMDSAALETVTREPAAGFGFEWSPDGGAILARVARFEGPFRLNAVKIFDLTGGEARQLTEYRSEMPAVPHWSTSGSRIYLHAGGRLEVFDSGMAEKAAGPEEVLVSDNERVLRAELSSGAIEPVLSGRQASDPTAGESTVLNLAPSPDGSMAAFERMGGNLFVVRSDGSGRVDLGPGNRPAWSPDGEWIVFTRSEDDGHNITASDLYVVHPDGSDLTRLTETAGRLEMNPSWSPDGARIAYDDLADGIIYVLPVTR